MILRTISDRVETMLKDTGPSIPEQQVKRVFDLFIRLVPSRSCATEGAGLVLPIAHAILCKHESDMALSNCPEGGLQETVPPTA